MILAVEEFQHLVRNANYTFTISGNMFLKLSCLTKYKSTSATIAMFRKKGYIEGRKPNVYLSAKIAGNSRQVGLKAIYVKYRSFDDDYFMDMILEYLKKFKQVSPLVYSP